MLSQACSQDLEKGGGVAFLKEWKKCKRPWPEFPLFLNQNHTVCPKIERKFLGKLGNSNVFSAQKQVVSKKKKKKIFTEIETDFSAKIGNSNPFLGRLTTCTSQLRHPISFGGGCFQFFTKNRPQKHQKRAVLHTSQANGGARSPPAPPLATLLCSVYYAEASNEFSGPISA